MSNKSPPPRPAPRLYLATPLVDDPAALVAELPALLASADVAAVLLRLKETDQRSMISRIKALASPFTVNTMPEGTLKAFSDHGELGPAVPVDGGDCEAVLAGFTKAGIDVDALATQLQEEGAKSFVKSWDDLMQVIASKSAALQTSAAH